MRNENKMPQNPGRKLGNGTKKEMLHTEPENDNAEAKHKRAILKATLGYPKGKYGADVDAELLAREEQEMEEAAERRLKEKKK